MTEDDAKEKWCPLSVLSVKCVASECMAWRFRPAKDSPLFRAAAHERAESFHYQHQGEARIIDVAYRNPPKGVDYDRHDGFCGLSDPASRQKDQPHD